MKRTQIYIDENTHDYLSLLAAEQSVSMAAVIRRFIKTGLENQQKNQDQSLKVMKNIAKLELKGGPKDLSTNLDHYLYGAAKNE